MAVGRAAAFDDLPRPLSGHPTYEFIRDLDAGHFGLVQVAVKCIPRGKGISRMTEREVCNHCVLQHPHFIEFKGVFLTNQWLCIVMEYCKGGNMLSYLNDNQGLCEQEARWFFQQEVLALDYAHRKGVCLRDIKLENTLLELRQKRHLIKFCDFGFTKSREDGLPMTKLGTMSYMAPEIIAQDSNIQNYSGELADVWSLGVMLYVKLFYKYPFEEKGTGTVSCKVLQQIERADYELPDRSAHGQLLSEPCKDLLRRMLVADPGSRLTVPQILHHPWVQQGLPDGLDRFNAQWIINESNRPRGYSLTRVRDVVRQARCS